MTYTMKPLLFDPASIDEQITSATSTARTRGANT
jgi:hypothetical protein